jgi:membrane protease YdiL (CAAX protease family)
MSEQSFVKRHSLIIYFVLAYAIAWIGSFVLGGPKFLSGELFEFEDIGKMALVALSAPFISGLLMTYLADGKSGLKKFYVRAINYRVGGRWYLPLLIFPILLLTVSIVLGVLISPEMLPVFQWLGIMAGPMAGFFEETGWMGFAYPKMSIKKSVLGAAIGLGIIHGIWHFAFDFLAQFNFLGGFYFPYFVGFLFHIIGLRVLIVWVYENTNSLLLAMLMHASSTGFYGIIMPTTMEPVNWAIFYVVYGVTCSLAALIVILIYGRTLKGKST